jgi:N-acetylmuramoyl-L-alanine amidase
MLDDLRLLEAHRGSLALARLVQGRVSTATGAGVATSDRGVRQAAYDVLSGLSMPAALVEVGFIDHPIEGAALGRPEMQRRIADALAEALFDFHAGLGRAPRRQARRASAH